jgi:hypothetical protein
MNEDYKSKIDEANDLTSHLPSEIRKEAFSVMLKHLLDGTSGTGGEESISSEASKSKTYSDFKEWELKVISSLPEPYMIAKKADREQQAAWGVITLFARKEPATSNSIRELIRNELGISPQNEANTSTKLKGLIPKYLTRVKDGKEFVYSPTVNSIELFQGLTEDD